MYHFQLISPAHITHPSSHLIKCVIYGVGALVANYSNCLIKKISSAYKSLLIVKYRVGKLYANFN